MNLIFIMLAVVVAGFEGAWTGPIQRLYASPSAYVSSFFLGVTPVMTKDNDVLLPLPGQRIKVTSQCSAFGFFCLLSALLLMKMPTIWPKKKILTGYVLALPLAYAITILANACRIICAYHIHQLGRMFLPDIFQAALHQGVGIAVFLSTLITVTLILERRTFRGQNS